MMPRLSGTIIEGDGLSRQPVVKFQALGSIECSRAWKEWCEAVRIVEG